MTVYFYSFYNYFAFSGGKLVLKQLSRISILYPCYSLIPGAKFKLEARNQQISCSFRQSIPFDFHPFMDCHPTNMTIKSDCVNLVPPTSPVHRARYSTNWDRKGWPGSEIPMYTTAARGQRKSNWWQYQTHTAWYP